jgi:nicotinamide-nucleotide amidase
LSFDEACHSRALASSARAETVAAIARRLRERGETLGIAESCTGGLVSAWIAALPGASDFYLGSVVAYSNRVKQDLLNVSPSLLRTVGAVSAPVALAMADGVRRLMKTDWGVSLTGIAGPGGGSLEKPVGTVFISWRGPGVEGAAQFRFGETLDRVDIQARSAAAALEGLQSWLESEPGVVDQTRDENERTRERNCKEQ